MVWMRLVRIALAAVVCAALVGATDVSVRASLVAPRTATVGLPVTVVVTVNPAPRSVVVAAARGALRMPLPIARAGTRWQGRIAFPGPGRWTLTARVAGKAVASRLVTVVEPSVRHPYAVVVDPRGRVFVADGAARRIVLISPVAKTRSVHAVGFDEPTGLAATRNALYVADYHAGLVRRVDAARRVTTLARLPQVTAVAATRTGTVYAVTMTGTLARISPAGAITHIAVPGGLDRPHGVALDRDGQLLVAEDSRRVRRIDPTTGRAELVVDGVDTNKIAVSRNGTLFLAGSSLTGGSLRRLEPGGKPKILLDDLKVSDVAVLPDGDLVATTVEPGAVYRVDARNGARTRLAP
jgi:glucose/arabinose dehydrogenase